MYWVLVMGRFFTLVCLGQYITNNGINHDDDDKYLFSMYDALNASSHLLF